MPVNDMQTALGAITFTDRRGVTPPVGGGLGAGCEWLKNREDVLCLLRQPHEVGYRRGADRIGRQHGSTGAVPPLQVPALRLELPSAAATSPAAAAAGTAGRVWPRSPTQVPALRLDVQGCADCAAAAAGL